MRVAVSGTHGTGKSTLVSELALGLPTYVTIQEPYYALLDEGHVFSAQPAAEDYEQLLERSMADLEAPLPANMLFDRCPIDYLAYLAALREPVGDYIPRLVDPVSRLDLIVYVPVETPDRVQVSSDENRALRRRVDAILRDMLLEDSLGLAASVIEVCGTPRERVQQVLATLNLAQ